MHVHRSEQGHTTTVQIDINTATVHEVLSTHDVETRLSDSYLGSFVFYRTFDEQGCIKLAVAGSRESLSDFVALY